MDLVGKGVVKVELPGEGQGDGEEPGKEAQDQGRPADELDEDESHGGLDGGRYPEALSCPQRLRGPGRVASGLRGR